MSPDPASPEKAVSTSPSPWPLRGVFALAFALFACGIWWGLPGRWGWAGDELHPSSWPLALSPKTPDGWHARYPPLHFAVLQGISFPLRFLMAHGVVPVSPDMAVVWLIYLGRLVSLAAALGIVWLVYRVGCEVYDRRSALFAALVTVCIMPLVYYAKTGNLDAPYVFWFVLSLLFYVRILKQHRLRDYLLFAAAAAAAVCTKDQAYGLYTLAPLPILISLYRREYRERGPVAGIARALVDRRLLLAGVTAAVLFALFQNLPWNPQRFAIHIRLLRGPMSENYQDYEDTAAGHQQLLSLFLKQVVFVLDPLLAAVCVAGLGVTLGRVLKRRIGERFDEETRLLGALFFLVVSYYVTFLNLILFSYDRYLLPVAIILAFFGGQTLGLVTRPEAFAPVWRRAVTVGVAAVFIYAVLYAASVDARMLADSRYYVEDWVREHAPRPVSVAAVGRRKHIPRFPWIPWERVVRTKGQILVRQRPQFLTVTVSDLRHPEEIEIYRQLSSGDLGYRLVLIRQSRALLDLPSKEELGSSQRFINPQVALFQRIDSVDPGEDEDGAGGGVPSGGPPVAHSAARRSVATQ
jgi:hypothetical protein